MSGNEIKERIAKNNELIAEALTPSIFELNKSIQKLIEENHYLQSICNHKIDETGICIYCNKKV